MFAPADRALEPLAASLLGWQVPIQSPEVGSKVKAAKLKTGTVDVWSKRLSEARA